MRAADPRARSEAIPGASLTSAIRWLLVVGLLTVALWIFRVELDKAHFALAYLLVVLVASARHGRTLGMGLAVLAFIFFNFFLLPPYYTLAIADPLDWIVLVVFLITSGIAAFLLNRAQEAAVRAQQRAEEIDRLSTLGAETLNAARAEEAVDAIARVLHSTLRISICEIHQWEPETRTFRCVGRARARHAPEVGPADQLFESVVDRGIVALIRADGTSHMEERQVEAIDTVLASRADAAVFLIPLRIRGRAVGLLRLADEAGIRLDPGHARFAGVLSYYAALGVERVGLAADAERAEALLEADRMKDAVLASLSHDLRTPLTTIKGLAHEIALGGEGRARSIEDEANRLGRLVTNLLDLSSLNAGAMVFVPEVTAVEDLVGAALDRIGGMQGGREILVSLDDEPILLGNFDFSQTLRIVVNLLENALRYAPSVVEIKARRDALWLILEVMDRGPGVSPSDVDRIFDPFYRVHPASPEATGAGLGLSIARRLAEGQSGTLRYADRPGGGSVFTLSLPGVDVEEASLGS